MMFLIFEEIIKISVAETDNVATHAPPGVLETIYSRITRIYFVYVACVVTEGVLTQDAGNTPGRVFGHVE